MNQGGTELDPSSFVAAFGITFMAELGDKTQLATILLSTRYRPGSVFAGALLGISIVGCLSVALGAAIGDLLPGQLVGMVCGSVLIILGLKTVASGGEGIRVGRDRSPFLTSFATIALMEFGDKTQFSLIALSARYGSPLTVLAGAVLAYVLLMGAGVLLGRGLTRLLPVRTLRTLAGCALLVLGAVFVLASAGVI